jgi:DNA-binding NtrC family response regulator
MRLRIPPLRDRREDILPYFEHFLLEESIRVGEPALVRYDERVGELLRAAPWDDNLRDVQSLARYVMAMRDPGETITVRHLAPDFLTTLGDLGAEGALLAGREKAARALERAGGNKAEAARALGISRSNLYRLLQDEARPA